MRIIFFGTPEIAVEVLKGLLKANLNIVAVVSNPDKPAGRGKKMTAPPMKIFAQKNNIPLLQPFNLKDNKFLEQLKLFNADLFVVVAFSKLPKEVWQIPPKGTINLHASYLPDYRGAAPINWVIINGEKETGVSVFFINEQIDKGNLILRKKIPIEFTDNATILTRKVIDNGISILLEAIEQIKNNTVNPIPQAELQTENLHKAPKITKEICKINWNQPTIRVYNHIRGLSEKPTAWTTMTNGNKIFIVKIYFAEPFIEKHTFSPATVIVENKKLKIATTDGFILPTIMQIQGKKPMNIEALLNGYKFESYKII